jgi:hypothetical protein
MDHATLDTDADALLAELDALLAEGAAMDARVEALLARPIHRSITSQLAALRVGIEALVVDTAALEAELHG